MENLVNWFEIPAKDFDRAVKFYGSVLNADIHRTEMMGSRMGFLPSDGKNVSGAIVQGHDYKISSDGVLMYLNGGNDLSLMLSRVEKAGGHVIVPKTQISPEIGYFALFIDSEGNKLALHSRN
jgi:uncharacterized protein